MYTVTRDPTDRVGRHWFSIHRQGRRVARLWNSSRLEDYGVVFLDGSGEDWPLGGNSLAFLEGGGPEPLRLTEGAERWLSEQLACGR